MGDEQEECNTGLCLGLGVGQGFSFKLYHKEEAINVDDDHNKAKGSSSLTMTEDDQVDFMNTDNNRKKLRLSKEQSSMLEDSFKLHSTPNQAQKHAIAEHLNLKPRQVEVWFQNRRARTKFKKAKVDCELLKKCCERLSDENKRLKKELQDLRSSLHVQFPKAAALTMCPSCEKENCRRQ